MKKQFTLGMLLLTSVFLKAQQQQVVPGKPLPGFSKSKTRTTPKIVRESVFWSEDFAGGFNSANGTWTTSGANGSGWYWTKGAPIGSFTTGVADTARTSTYKNGYMLFGADSMQSGGATQWTGQLVSPTIDLTGTSSVRVRFQQYLKFCCNDDAKMTLGYSVDDGLTWSDINVRPQAVNDVTDNPEQLEFVIPELVGEATVKIRFNWEQASYYWWCVDDIEILDNPNYELRFADNFMSHGTDLEPFRYLIQPRFLDVPYAFNAVVDNKGNKTTTNTTLNLTIENHNGTLFSGSVSDSIVNASRDTLSILADFPELGLGIYSADYSISHDSIAVDENKDGLDLSFNFQVTDSIWGRDDDTIVGGIWNGEYNAGQGDYKQFYSGVVYSIPQPAVLSGIQFVPYTGTDAGVSVRVYVGIWDEDTGIFMEQYNNELNEYVLTQEDLQRGLVNIPLALQVQMDAGEFVRVVVGMYDSDKSLIIAYSDEPTFNYALFRDEAWGEFAEQRMPMIRMIAYSQDTAAYLHDYDLITDEFRIEQTPGEDEEFYPIIPGFFGLDHDFHWALENYGRNDLISVECDVDIIKGNVSVFADSIVLDTLFSLENDSVTLGTYSAVDTGMYTLYSTVSHDAMDFEVHRYDLNDTSSLWVTTDLLGLDNNVSSQWFNRGTYANQETLYRGFFVGNEFSIPDTSTLDGIEVLLGDSTEEGVPMLLYIEKWNALESKYVAVYANEHEPHVVSAQEVVNGKLRILLDDKMNLTGEDRLFVWVGRNDGEKNLELLLSEVPSNKAMSLDEDYASSALDNTPMLRLVLSAGHADVQVAQYAIQFNDFWTTHPFTHQGIQYVSYPVFMEISSKFNAAVLNDGSQNLDDLEMRLMVLHEGDSVLADTIVLDSLMTLTEDTMRSNAYYLPSDTGEYTAYAWILQDSCETRIDSLDFWLTDSLIAKEDGTRLGRILNPNSDEGQGDYKEFSSGSSFEISAHCDLHVVPVGLHISTDVGVELILILEKWSASSSAFEMVYTNANEPYVVTQADITAGWANLMLPAPEYLKNNDLVRVWVKTVGGDKNLAIAYGDHDPHGYAYFRDEFGTKWPEDRMPLIRLMVSEHDLTLSDDQITMEMLHVTLAPNPVQDQLTLTLEGQLDEQLMVQIFDLQGKRVLQQTVRNNSRLELNTSNLTSGMYTLKVQGKTNNYRTTFVVE